MNITKEKRAFRELKKAHDCIASDQPFVILKASDPAALTALAAYNNCKARISNVSKTDHENYNLFNEYYKSIPQIEEQGQ